MAEGHGVLRIQTASVTRLRSRRDQRLDALLDELLHASFDVQFPYLGVWCDGCGCDVLPMPNGRCGWCQRRLPKAAA